MGLVGCAAIFSWVPWTVSNFTEMSRVVGWLLCLLLAAAVGLYLAFFALIGSQLKRRYRRSWPWWTALLFAGLEFIQPQLFPYTQGSTWYQESWVFLSVVHLGVPAVTFALLLVNTVIWQALSESVSIFSRRLGATGEFVSWRVTCLNGAGAVAVWLLLVGLSAGQEQRISEQESDNPETIRLALIQTNLTNDQEARSFRSSRRYSAYLFGDCLRGLDLDSIDALVYPEGCLRTVPLRESQRHGFKIEVWAGGIHFDREAEKQYNSGYFFGRDRFRGRYDKVKLLAFGEYYPFGERRFEFGSGPKRFDAAKASFVFLICYEATINSYARQSARELDPDLFVNITYDAWFGDTQCPHQHLMLSAIQSALHGRPLVRSATTGICAFVDARGRIVQQGDLAFFPESEPVGEPPPEPKQWVDTVRLVKAPGLYTACGDLFAWGALIAALAAWLVGLRRGARESIQRGEPQ